MYFCLYGKKLIFLWKNAHGMLVGKKKELNSEYIVYFCCFLEKNHMYDYQHFHLLF